MGSEAVEVRVISRACAVLLAVITCTLVSTLELPSPPPTGSGSEFSIQVVRKRTEKALAVATTTARSSAKAAVQRATVSLIDAGTGMDVRLWLESPEGELVFASAERHARCLAARAQRREDADCPSASDRRRMVLERKLDRRA